MQQTKDSSQQQTMNFPSAGIDLATAFSRQRPRQIIGKGLQVTPTTGQPIVGGFDLQAQQDPYMWARSTPSGINVRGYEPQENRRRGGSRCGMSQFIPSQADGANIVQCLAIVIGNVSTLQDGALFADDGLTLLAADDGATLILQD